MPARLTAGCDTVWLDFTKGLAAPLGAVLAGSKQFIGEAWRWKQRLGGSMRQGGICAAACLYALDHNIDRLAEDHANAKALARGMAQIPGITVEHPETNLVFFDTKGTGMTAAAFAGKLRRHGVLVSVSDTYRARACLHLDVTRGAGGRGVVGHAAGGERLSAAFQGAAGGFRPPAGRAVSEVAGAPDLRNWFLNQIV